MDRPRLFHRVLGRLLAPIARNIQAALATVTAYSVGTAKDGMVPIQSAGTTMDKRWYDLRKELTDSLTAWRKNPLARRIVGLITAYVLGGEGIELRSAKKDSKLFATFLKKFVDHPQNRWFMRQHDWCDSLTTTGEIFPTLHTNPADGMSYVRAIPASRMQRIEWLDGDIEAETYYYEEPKQIGDDPKQWKHPRSINLEKNSDPPEAAMLHFAINRPVGCVRGESDLAPILPWLKYYSRWLEDRVSLNAALRAFLWICSVPSKLVRAKSKQYASAPSPGSVLVVDRDAEKWEAVTPEINARDVALDGRALRWMIVAGGPGMSLLDLGESETANLASSRALAEQRRRFLRRRQAYFGYILAEVAVQAWNRSVALGKTRGTPATVADIEIGLPDISPEDNVNLTLAAKQITNSLLQLRDLTGETSAFKRLVLRIFLRNVAERVSEEDFDEIVGGVAVKEIVGGVAVKEIVGGEAVDDGE